MSGTAVYLQEPGKSYSRKALNHAAAAMRISRKQNKEAARKRVIKKLRSRGDDTEGSGGTEADDSVTEVSVGPSGLVENEHMRELQDWGVLQDLPNGFFQKEDFRLCSGFAQPETFPFERFDGGRSFESIKALQETRFENAHLTRSRKCGTFHDASALSFGHDTPLLQYA
jgi:hypothetical protein